MNSYGPSINEKYQLNDALLKFIQDSTKYVSKLSNFKKYCIWRYTIGSASVNSYLIFNTISDNATYWTYLFFKYYNNSFSSAEVEAPFKRWAIFFKDPRLYIVAPESEKRQIAEELIKRYVLMMSLIIKKAPRSNGSFHVFKVTSKYPALPDNNTQVPIKIKQLPFNSTTILPYFNFAPFISADATCCLFDILVPQGSMCLYVPEEIHAYPFEKEIILAPGAIFDIKNVGLGTLNYVDPKTVSIIRLQDEKDTKIGNVYSLNEYFPCGQNPCMIERKAFTVYDADLL
jgi:hypothetical protein